MYEAVKDNQPLVAEDRIIEPDTSLVEFSTSAVAVMEDVGTLQVKTFMKIFSLSKIFSIERMKMQNPQFHSQFDFLSTIYQQNLNLGLPLPLFDE